MQSSWLSKSTLKDTYFAVSDSGWMTTTTFHDWFEKFIKKVERFLMVTEHIYLWLQNSWQKRSVW